MFYLSPKRVNAAALVATLLVLMAGALSATSAEARAGGGFSFGSRGSRSFSMPATTPTAPRYSQPFQDSEASRFRPGMTSQPRRFGFGSGLLAGLLGAGLFGMFTGAGFFGGIAALIGLLFKIALIGGVIWLVFRLFRGRARPVMAGGPQGFNGPSTRDGVGMAYGGGAPSGGPVTIEPADYQAFEQMLGAIQDAYSREDVAALSRLATPEMVRRFAGDLEGNRRRGLRNDVSRVKLLQGDLSESWSEGNTAFATVAMRFSGVDVMLDRNTGRIASGDPVRPAEVAELWTFRRDGRRPWILSGIQQAG